MTEYRVCYRRPPIIWARVFSASEHLHFAQSDLRYLREVEHEERAWIETRETTPWVPIETEAELQATDPATQRFLTVAARMTRAKTEAAPVSTLVDPPPSRHTMTGEETRG